MKSLFLTTFVFLAFLFTGCIGDDVIDDFIEPVLRISNNIDTLGKDDNFTFTTRFFNDVGQEESIQANWTSSNPSSVSIDANGLATALEAGEATITAEVTFQDITYQDDTKVVVGEETIVITEPEIIERTGNIQVTSNYILEGSFSLIEEDERLILNFEDDYEASPGLPGLYIYLTNNPNSINGALEISRVTTFSGAHSYEIPEGTGIDDFQFILYFCKPFNVKIGDGRIEE